MNFFTNIRKQQAKNFAPGQVVAPPPAAFKQNSRDVESGASSYAETMKELDDFQINSDSDDSFDEIDIAELIDPDAIVRAREKEERREKKRLATIFVLMMAVAMVMGIGIGSFVNMNGSSNVTVVDSPVAPAALSSDALLFMDGMNATTDDFILHDGVGKDIGNFTIEP